MTDRYESDVEDIDYVKNQKNRIKESAENITGSLSESLEGLKGYAHDAGQRLQGWLKNVGNQANTSMETVENKIRARPFLAASAAFAVGMIASKLMTARK